MTAPEAPVVPGEPVGLIAGLGRFPVEVAQAARARGYRVVAVALDGLAVPEVASSVDACTTLAVGQLERLFATFRSAGVKRLVMAGKVPKTFLFKNRDRVDLDARAVKLLGSIADRKDDSILGAVADELEQEGFELLGQGDLTPELWAAAGTLGAVDPTPAQWADLAFGFPVARALGELDVGQTVVVEGLAVLALEAIEGTDEAIRRGGALGGGGACVVKLAKPGQDPRFDVPAVGAATVSVLAEAGAAVLGVEAGRTILLQRDEMLAAADAAGIALVGVDERTLRPGGQP